jgi:hypothetical protein
MYCHISSFYVSWVENREGDQKCKKNQNRGARLFDFKIEGPNLQNLQNRGTKTAIKPNILILYYCQLKMSLKNATSVFVIVKY